MKGTTQRVVTTFDETGKPWTPTLKRTDFQWAVLETSRLKQETVPFARPIFLFFPSIVVLLFARHSQHGVNSTGNDRGFF